ncbi:thioesterase family protein [Nocardioides sp.]|nr:thioesterase family protein [Nocardioides sp.]
MGWFRRDGDTYTPLPLAQSLWRADQMHGVAVSGLLARTLEQRVAVTGRTDLVPARYHVDLFRPARMTATTSSATIVREGPRLLLLDAVVEQDGEVVARAGATFLTSSQNPPGEVWSAEDRPSPPPADVAPSTGEHHVPIFASGKPWSDDFTEHQNAGRHQTWQTAMPIVVDEECTPFQAVASIADATSMVTNWGSGGVEFINTDISLAIARLPESASLGLRTTDHVASAGVAVGTAEVFDRLGPIGTATVTSLANTRRTVDLSASEWDGSKGTPGV